MATQADAMMIDNFRRRLQEQGSLTLTIRVRTKAQRSEVRDCTPEGVLRVDVRAVPEDGEANAEVIDVLAEAFDVPESCVCMVSGHRWRTKIVKVTKP